MRRLSLPLLAALLLIGCGDNLEPGDDQPGGALVTDGGRAPIVDCDRDVVTRAGAEAPQAGGDTVGPDPAPFHVHLGVGGDPARSIAVVWRTDLRTTATELELGVGGLPDRRVTGVTYRYRASGGDLVRVHEVHLCGLTPDTPYTYRVGGGEAWSPTHGFRTAPDVTASPDASVRIAMTGDSRNGYPMWSEVAADIADHAPDLIVFSGDAVNTGSVQAQWDDFFTAAADLLAGVPMVSANGNHEANAVNFYSQLAMPGDEENFGITLGDARITVVNDGPADADDLGGAIRDFLDADLSGDAIWKIVAHHRPLWSSGTTHGSNAGLRAAWGATLDAHHADLVVAGHDHIYERTLPIRGDQIQDRPADGTIYLVNGGAGAPLYDVDPEPFSAHAEARHGWVLVDVRRDRMIVEAYEPGGAVPFDTLTITRP